jgi:hypothetical protein
LIIALIARFLAFGSLALTVGKVYLRPRKEKEIMARKYGRRSQKDVKSAMHEFKRGKLKSGRSEKKVKSRKQAIAIGLSKARKHGAKVPAKSQ